MSFACEMSIYSPTSASKTKLLYIAPFINQLANKLLESDWYD